MIDVSNQRLLTQAERLEIVRRAVHTQPYFYRMDFPVVTGVAKTVLTSDVLGINRDFFLTELQGNFDQVFTDSGTLFDITLYSNYNRSLWRYDANRKLPTGFCLTDARFRVPVATQLFDDKQFENFPILIQKNDRVFGEIVNVDAKVADSNAVVVLKGFNVSPEAYIDGRELEDINKAVEAPRYSWEFFKFTVEAEASKKPYVVNNDRFPRLVVGFGVINSTAVKADVSEALVTIEDISRRVRLTDDQIPVEFIAPRLTCLADAHLYYLPIEYYWQPLGKLLFTLENIPAVGNDAGLEFVILTRTP